MSRDQPIAPARKRFRWSRPVEFLVAGCLLVVGCAAPLECQHPASSRDAAVPATVAATVPSGMLVCALADGGAHCELQGNTNIGTWSSTSADIRTNVAFQMDTSQLDGLFQRLAQGAAIQWPAFPIRIEPPSVLKVSVPVASFRGQNSEMDRDMRAALKAPLHPDIGYELVSVQSVRMDAAAPEGRPAIEVRARGQLSVAGVRRPTDIHATIYRDSRGHVIIHAKESLLMSDFGVTPPTGLFGLIHAHNPMSVDFDLDFVPRGARVR